MRLFTVTLFILQAIGWGLFQDSIGSVVTGPTIFSKMPISGGGFIIVGPDIQNDGSHGTSILTGSDVYGCEKWNSGTSSWKELATINNGSGIGITGINSGCWFVAAAPSNTNYIAMMIGNGELYRSTDGGVTFADTTFNSASNPNQNAQRVNGPRAAFDPINPDVLYIATGGAGVYVTTNFTTGTASAISFAQVSTIPTVTNNQGYAIAFDKNGGTTSGKTNIVYVNPYGSNIYQATSPVAAGTPPTPPTFSAVTGGPQQVNRMVVDPNGTIWAADSTNADKGTGCRSSCTWTVQSTGLPDGASVVAVDPNQCSSGATCHVVFMGGGNVSLCESGSGTISATANGGSTWVASTGHTRTATDSPWLAQTNEFNMCPGGMAIDPNGLLWFGEGIGVWTTTPNYSSAANTAWTSATKGITNLDANGVLSPPSVSNKAITWQWDRSTFTSDTVHEPSAQQPNVLFSIQAGWTMDVASSDGTTLAMVDNFVGFDSSSISTNAGTSWVPFPSSTIGQVTLTTTAITNPGSGVLTFSSVPGTVRPNMVVADVTTPSAISADSRVIQGGNTGTQIVFNTSSGGGAAGTVGSGDTITVSYPNTPYSRQIVTNASASSGQTLSFSSVPAWMHVGMAVSDASGCVNNTGGVISQVLSLTSTTVTLNELFLCGIGNGEAITFAESPGGTIAVSTPNNMLFVASNADGPPVYTKDGGATWLLTSMPNVEDAGSGCVSNGSAQITSYSGNANHLVTSPQETVLNNQGVWGAGISSAGVVSIVNSSTFNVSRLATTTGCGVLLQFINYSGSYLANNKTACADRSASNTFYVYNQAIGQIFKSSNSGDTWTNQSSSTPLNASPFSIGAFGTILKCVPGQAGNLFFSSGGTSGDHFAKSTDGGVTWTSVPNVTNVQAFGLGAAKPGGSGYPTIFIFGVLNGVTLGTFRSDDGGTTWIQLGGVGEYNPVYSIQQITDIEGDKSVYGKVYGSYSGGSYFCGAITPGC